jgi:hypothetical protein
MNYKAPRSRQEGGLAGQPFHSCPHIQKLAGVGEGFAAQGLESLGQGAGVLQKLGIL